MAIFENDICPVCQKEFTEGDDIVVCPECGTPHHRECYNQLGRCANTALHSQGYVFKRAASYKAESEKKAQSDNMQSFFASLAAAEQGSDNAEEQAQQAENTATQSPFVPPQLGVQEGVKDIDGEPVHYIAATVGANARRFVRVFSKNKTLGWNWSAFIFGPYYFLYRKMFKEGVFIVALEIVLRMAVSMIFQDIVATVAQGYNTIVQSIMQNTVTSTEGLEQLANLFSSTGYNKVAFIEYVLIILVHIVCALLADGVYKKRVLGIVKEADARLEQDAFFGTTTFMGQSEDARPEEIKRLYLSSRGGVSVFMPLCIYFLVTFLFNMF